jgi:hypothetical protein
MLTQSKFTQITRAVKQNTAMIQWIVGTSRLAVRADPLQIARHQLLYQHFMTPST